MLVQLFLNSFTMVGSLLDRIMAYSQVMIAFSDEQGLTPGFEGLTDSLVTNSELI